MLESLWKKILRRKPLSLWNLAVPFLWVMSVIYRLLAWFNRKWHREKIQLPVPVISVGNISVGGTGKTPVVDFLARSFIEEGFRVGIVSSGWGRQSEQSFIEPGYRVQTMSPTVTGDEVKFLAMQLPEAIFAVSTSKTTAAQQVVNTGKVDLIIVDDGFQHYPLARNIDIVTYDAAVPKRQLKLFPLGVLRESTQALKRADIVLITRTNFSKDITLLRKKLSTLNPHADQYRAQFIIKELVGKRQRLPVKYLSDKSVLLFAGVGNFSPLRKQVDALAGDLKYALELSDHQEYTEDVLREIKDLASQNDVDVIITTGKDWVKIRDFDFGCEIYYLVQTVDLDPGEEKLVARLQKALALDKRNA